MKSGLKIAFVVLYSDKFAMTGEAHGVSVLAGVVKEHFDLTDNQIMILDLYGSFIKNRLKYICSRLSEFMPDVVGFSCPYGTYTTMLSHYAQIAKCILKAKLIIFGGALPTYIPERYLDLDKTAYVIRGEGEEAIVGLLEMYLNHDDTTLRKIPNLCYYLDGQIYYNERRLVNLNNIVKPYREHLGISLRENAQIYVEHSRGCTWGYCTFCSRNLLSLKNCPEKYRKFRDERLIQDLLCLKEKGIRSVTFSDEDFCGTGMAEMQHIATIFQEINQGPDKIRFDVSMNVNSIYCEKWNCNFRELHNACFLELKKSGLRKVFIGVESGSRTQLKRYQKQHSVKESEEAIRFLEQCGIEIEMGYIIFDPLCTMDEVIEDLYFLKRNNLAKYVSSLGSGLMLRLQMDTPYIQMLQAYEKKHRISLHDDAYDWDTLNYCSSYADKDVKQMAECIERANRLIRPLYYPLKSMSRYGQNGSLKGSIFYIKDIVVQIRENYLDFLIKLAGAIKTGEDVDRIILGIQDYVKKLFDKNRERLVNTAHETDNQVLLNLVNGNSCL